MAALPEDQIAYETPNQAVYVWRGTTHYEFRHNRATHAVALGKVSLDTPMSRVKQIADRLAAYPQNL